MDPLSVAASITGLLTASIEVAKLFAAFGSTYDYAQTVHDEIHHFRFLLFRLDKSFQSDSLARASMIDLDQVVAVLMGCILTISELEREAKRLQSVPQSFRLIRWTIRKSTLVDLVQRLQNYKGTIAYMLAILTSEWEYVALDDIYTLRRNVAVLSRLNAEMASRLDLSDAAVVSSSASIPGSVMTRTNFENTLKNSRVYRRALLPRGNKPTLAAKLPSDWSWSIMSGLSIAELPNHATYNLPIAPQELYNPTWYMGSGKGAALETIMPEVPVLDTITRDLSQSLVVALKQNDMETAKTIANYIPWECALEMSALFPTLGPHPLDSLEVLDRLALFKLWLQCGGDSEAKNQRGQTAIKKALENEDWWLFKLLAQNGSDINLTCDSKTILHYVLGDEAFALALCEDIEEEERAELDPTGNDLERKRGQAVEFLLKLGADINSTDGWEKTALHWSSEGGHKGVVEVLLSRGADIHAKDMWGTTSLHWASEGGYKVVVEVLLNHGADINAKDRWGMTAIYYALEGGYRGVVEVLLSHGADIGAEDKWEKTALHCASWGGDKGVVEALLSHGADIHAKDMWGTTSLHWASEGGHKGVVKVLLNHGADINAKDRWGMTALHHASEGGHKGVIKTLLGHGVDIHAKDRTSKTARHLASESGHKGVVELLLSNEVDI